MRREAKRPLLVGTVILVVLSIFMKSQASSPFEAMNSAHLSMCQKDVRPSVQKSFKKKQPSNTLKHNPDSFMGDFCQIIQETDIPFLFRLFQKMEKKRDIL